MFERKSVAIQWLGTYSLLLIIPIVISTIIFVSLGENAKEETYKTNMMMLNSVKSDVDDSLFALKKTYMELSLDADLKKTMKEFENSRQEGLMQAGDLWRRAKSVVALNDFVEEIYIGFINHDIALYTNGGIHELESVNSIVFGQNGSKELSDVLKGQKHGVFHKLDTMENGKPKSKICYVGKISSNPAKDDIEVMIVVCADVQRLMTKIMSTSETSQRNISILDENNNIVLSTNDSVEIDVSKRNDVMYTEGKNVVSFLEFETAQWCCVAVASKEIFWGSANRIRFLCIAGVILSMLLGGIYTVYILKRNYTPIDNILKYVGKNKEKNFLKGENEYDILFDTLSNAISEENASKLIAMERGKIIRDIYLKELLQRGFTGHLIEEDLSELKFPSNRFSVVIFDIENCGEEGQKIDPIQIVDSVMSETIGKFYLCHIVRVETNLVAVVSYADGEKASQEELIKTINVGCSALEENFNIMLNAIVSSVCEGEDKITEGYRETLEMLEYTKISGLTGVILCDEMNIKNEYYYPIEKDVELSNVIKTGDTEKARTIIEEIFKYNFEEKKLTMKSGRCLIVDIAATLLKITSDETLRMNIADICYIQNDIQKTKDEIISAVEVICEHNLAELEKQSPKIEVVKEYIKERYSDPMLTIQTISEHFGWSPYYLSRTFKNKTNIGIIEYIRHIRVEKAKEILEENPIIRLEKLAESIGMNGTRTLARAFKQELGILPAEYKKMLGKDDEK